MNTLLAQWVPIGERSRIGSFVFAGTINTDKINFSRYLGVTEGFFLLLLLFFFPRSGNMIGTIVAQSSAGYLLKVTDDNWPLVFYITGTVAIIWYALWNFLVYNSPNEHPTITDYELAYLERNLKGVNKNKVQPCSRLTCIWIR